MNVEICPFTMEAYDRVFALWTRSEGVGLSEADAQEGIDVYLKRNPGMSFVAMAAGELVGAVLSGHDGRRGYIHHLTVDHRWRRRAVGRRLVDSCLAALQRAGIQKCHIFIFNQNADGIAFWKSVGWIPRDDIGVISKNIETGRGSRNY
ncbi:MAG TPA: GNAT family N-acetyltransferase [Verrucomicrobiae bacterium]|nr:GNAT family N-acetyltransferase [Verrucomicrobiae bacterium]